MYYIKNRVLPFGKPIIAFIIFSLLIIMPLICVPAIFFIMEGINNSKSLIISGICLISFSLIFVTFLFIWIRHVLRLEFGTTSVKFYNISISASVAHSNCQEIPIDNLISLNIEGKNYIFVNSNDQKYIVDMKAFSDKQMLRIKEEILKRALYLNG